MRLMKKYLFAILIVVSLFITACSKNCDYLTEKETSWGVEYSWAYVDANHKMTFYTLMQGNYDLGNTFYEKGELDENLNHAYVKEYKNAEINEIERIGGKIKSITVNKKKYIFN